MLKLEPTEFRVKVQINNKDHEFIITERGPDAWALLTFMGYCMSKTKLSFELEPSPSNRTDEWIADHRFATPEEASDYLQKFLDKKMVGYKE